MSHPPRILPRPGQVLLLVPFLVMSTPAWAIDGSMGEGLFESFLAVGVLLTLLGAGAVVLPFVLGGGMMVAFVLPGWETEKGVGGRSGRQAFNRCVLASPLTGLVALVASIPLVDFFGGGDLARYAMLISVTVWFLIMQLGLGWVARRWAFNKRLRDRFSDEGCKLQVTTARR